MTYLRELRDEWRPLLAAFIGLGCGFSTTSYVVSIMAPHMLAEFGWSKSEFALVGTLGLVSVLVFPFVGRLTDRIGVRGTALIGVTVYPIAYFALSRMTGDIRIYIGLYLFQGILCVTTTSTVYCRTVVQYIRNARGLALAIVASGPAITGAIGGPLLNNFVEAHGWRAGYLALVAFATVAGAVALFLLPADRPVTKNATAEAKAQPGDYAMIIKRPEFWILCGSMFLCNLPQVIALTQLNLVMLDNGVSTLQVSGMISAFASGTLLGRFICGLALDRFPAHRVAGFGMALSAVGLFLIASNFDAWPVLMLAVLLLGLSFGAEGDVISYLVVRNFGVRVFSTVMGIMTAVISISVSLGAALLSLSLKLTGDFTIFLTLCGVTVFLGALLFFLMPRYASAEQDTAEL